MKDAYSLINITFFIPRLFKFLSWKLKIIENLKEWVLVEHLLLEHVIVYG
jgi:hypothetical protein